MASSSYLLLQILLFVLFISFSFTTAHNKSRKSIPPPKQDVVDYKGCFSKVYAFGDSYTDTGNAYSLGGLKSFLGGFASRSNPYGSSTNLPGHRLCNGRLVIDFLCESLSIPHLPSYKLGSSFSNGANFAIAGSTVLSTDFFNHYRMIHSLMWKGIPQSFQTQIDWFNKFLQETDCKGMEDSECKAQMEDTLFWIGEMGGNDYSRIFGSHFAARLLTEVAVGHICQFLKTLLDRGAKYVVIQGLPPAGCLPLDLSLCPSRDRDQMGCSASANSVIRAHNELLQKRLAEIRSQYSDCMIVYADYWNAYQTILTNHKKYQFEEPFKACCGATGQGTFNFDMDSLCGSAGTSTCKEPNKYINWDGVHLTEAMHQHLADLFFNRGFCKPSFEVLIKKKRGM
ncbi:hypothetical protein FNV43_RR25860 [Rhamnella rubrinervis]|uniref:Uncharacterized protein n=1 Tax=Rhamnella rubrinervis TaxID=2594499 RepID=A0A8K0DNQ2_9ROSA|nr:hypothetical protein FNV43_RR25860 [Rhamnella rubrinervis]